MALPTLSQAAIDAANAVQAQPDVNRARMALTLFRRRDEGYAMARMIARSMVNDLATEMAAEWDKGHKVAGAWLAKKLGQKKYQRITMLDLFEEWAKLTAAAMDAMRRKNPATRRNPVTPAGWTCTTAASDGYHVYARKLGNVEMKVEGFDPAVCNKLGLPVVWNWTASTITGKYRGKEGTAPALKLAVQRAEEAAATLGARANPASGRFVYALVAGSRKQPRGVISKHATLAAAKAAKSAYRRGGSFIKRRGMV